jgi:hypothetical protein
MKKLFFALALSSILAATATGWADDDMEGVEINFNELPASVQQIVLKSFDVKNISQIEKKAEVDTVQYDVEGISDGKKMGLTFAADGTLIQKTVDVGFASLPKLAKKALINDYPNEEIIEINKVIEAFYHVKVIVDGAIRDIEVKASGDIEDENDNDGIYDNCEKQRRKEWQNK